MFLNKMRIKKNMDINDLKEIIQNSTNELKKSEGDIFELNANERTIVSKLACLIQTKFNENKNNLYKVDAEYNRNIDKIKEIECSILLKKRKRYPDIIIHIRKLGNLESNDKNNFAIIEVKKNMKYKESLDDITKIKCMMTSYPYNYLYGIYINLNSKKNFNGDPEFIFFRRIGNNNSYSTELCL